MGHSLQSSMLALQTERQNMPASGHHYSYLLQGPCNVQSFSWYVQFCLLASCHPERSFLIIGLSSVAWRTASIPPQKQYRIFESNGSAYVMREALEHGHHDGEVRFGRQDQLQYRIVEKSALKSAYVSQGPHQIQQKSMNMLLNEHQKGMSQVSPCTMSKKVRSCLGTSVQGRTGRQNPQYAALQRWLLDQAHQLLQPRAQADVKPPKLQVYI